MGSRYGTEGSVFSTGFLNRGPRPPWGPQTMKGWEPLV